MRKRRAKSEAFWRRMQNVSIVSAAGLACDLKELNSHHPNGTSALQFENMADYQDLAPDYSWLDGGQSYIVCAYYTPDYLVHAVKLKRSLEALRVNHFLKRFEPSGGWAAGTRIKPAFLEECLSRFHPKHILYVDADAEVQKPLTALDCVTSDIAMCFIPVEKHVRLSVGTIYVRNTEGGRRFLANWRSEGAKAPPAATDSEAMHKVFSQTPGLTIEILPQSYIGRDDEAETVVQHFSVSRSKRKHIKRRRRRLKFLGSIAALGAVCVAGWYFISAFR